MASTRQKVIKGLDAIFSKFIRMRASDDSGYAECFTCGKTSRWKEGDAGHFMSRGAYSTRWNETNVQFQCKRCNIFQNGQQYLYSVALDGRYGGGTADALYTLSKQTRKFSEGELRAMIEIYKDKVEELREAKGLE
tara:strand:+ start:2524 stop:2931 length:408 start_codon:yes stop_codon:yes gene_type:complete